MNISMNATNGRTSGPATVIEAALNGPWGPAKQPGMPFKIRDIVAQGIACAKAGAAVIHIHPYDEVTGRQNDQFDTYRAIIEGIREHVDVVVYPSAPFDDQDSGSRFAVTEQLAQLGLIEWATLDPGSANVVRFTELDAGSNGFVYANSCATIRAGLEIAERLGFRPAYACYEPGFVRTGARLHAQFPKAPVPIYRLMFSDDFSFGFPPTETALKAYKELLDREAGGAPVMVSGLGVDITRLIPTAVAFGYHVRVGLEDEPLGSLMTNVQLVERAIERIVKEGGTIASVAQARCI